MSRASKISSRIDKVDSRKWYIHFDNDGRPDFFTGDKFKTKAQAIKVAKTFENHVHVSELIKVKDPWGKDMVDGFDKPAWSSPGIKNQNWHSKSFIKIILDRCQ